MKNIQKEFSEEVDKWRDQIKDALSSWRNFMGGWVMRNAAVFSDAEQQQQH